MPEQHLQVLIIEDNPGDVYLLKEALQAVCPCNFRVLSHGDRAFAFFEGRVDEGSFTPDVVVLDLNLPGKEGSEVLQLIRRSPAHQSLPVIILSSSPTDVMKSRVATADCYMTKPIDLDDFMALGKEIVECCRRVTKDRAAGSR